MTAPSPQPSEEVSRSKWSLSRGLSYFFGNRDTYEELIRLRAENYELRERLLEKAKVRPLGEKPDKIETVPPKPDDDYETWKQRREAEILEEKALPAAKDPVMLEQYEYFAEVDPELWNPVLLKAHEIRTKIADGTYREPQER